MSLRKNPIDFTLGTDSELLVCKTNQLIRGKMKHGAWGYDGGGYMRINEIRTIPSKNPIEVFNNIRNIFQRKVISEPNYLQYKWLAGSFVKERCLGSHIHVGILPDKINPVTIAEHFDHYVGSLSVLLEDTAQGIRRRNWGNGEDINGNPYYGNKLDYRAKKHGMEYRSIASFLSSPHVTCAFLCLAKIVAYELLNNPSFHWNGYVSYADFNQMRKNNILAKFPKIWSDLEKMHLFKQYEPQIQILKLLIENHLSWFPTVEMKEAWGIVSPKVCQPTVKIDRPKKIIEPKVPIKETSIENLWLEELAQKIVPYRIPERDSSWEEYENANY